MNWEAISDVHQLDLILRAPEEGGVHWMAILKHSPRCAISKMAKTRLERNTDPRVHYFLVDVLSDRPVSNALAERTEIKHESPQLFLYKNDQLVDVRSHMAINPAEITRRLDAVIETEN